jgi:hypothetical protein
MQERSWCERGIRFLVLLVLFGVSFGVSFWLLFLGCWSFWRFLVLLVFFAVRALVLGLGVPDAGAVVHEPVRPRLGLLVCGRACQRPACRGSGLPIHAGGLLAAAGILRCVCGSAIVL